MAGCSTTIAPCDHPKSREIHSLGGADHHLASAGGSQTSSRGGSRGSSAGRAAGRGRSRVPLKVPSIELRSPAEIELLRAAGSLAALALVAAQRACVAGATTRDVDAAAHQVIRDGRGEALFVAYRGAAGNRPAYPSATCISVNEELVHGVPGPRIIRDGDLVSIDVGVRLDGWCADSATTVCVGTVDPKHRALLACAQAMLNHAIRASVPGRRWSSIARELEQIADDAGFAVAVDFVGHGIGRELHEPPQVPCSAYRSFVEHADFTLRPGMVLAIEPMVVAEKPLRTIGGELANPACTLAADEWTVIVDSGAVSCHFEHTVVVTREGAEVLTRADRAQIDLVSNLPDECAVDVRRVG